jgi:hypothetical protein
MLAGATEGAFTVIDGGLSDTVSEKVEVKCGSKSWAASIRRRAKDLVKDIDTSYMELARVLWEVHDTPVDGNPQRAPIYTLWGYKTFAEYALSELNMEKRKAERLRLMHYKIVVEMDKLDKKTKARLIALGFTKLRDIIPHLTMRNVEQWVGFAETASTRQVQAAAKVEAGRKRQIEVDPVERPADEGEPTQEELDAEARAKAQADAEAEEREALSKNLSREPYVKEHFQLYAPQHENVRLALEKAKALCHSDKKGHQLDMICLDFLATNDFMGNELDKRLRYLRKIEMTLGLKLIAVDPQAKDIVYGLETLQLIADS